MASIIFLDSPVGSGFSYARDPKGYNVGDYSSSLQVVTFLKKVKIEHNDHIYSPVVSMENDNGRTDVSVNYLTSFACFCSGSRIIHSIFQILSTLEEIHMLER